MNNITSCDRYKIGFFILLILLVGLFGFIASSSSTNFSYKNRASETRSRKALVLPSFTPSAKGNPSNLDYPLFVTISTFAKKDGETNTYLVSFKETSFPSIDGKVPVRTGEIAITSTMSETTSTSPVEPKLSSLRSGLDCIFVSATNTIPVEGNPDTLTPTTAPISIEGDFLDKQLWKDHTYKINYTAQSPTPSDQQKTCKITSIIQSDSPPITVPTTAK